MMARQSSSPGWAMAGSMLDRHDIRRALRLFSQMITLFAALVALAAAFTF